MGANAPGNGHAVFKLGSFYGAKTPAKALVTAPVRGAVDCSHATEQGGMRKGELVE